MKIIFLPQRRDCGLVLIKDGDAVTINDEHFEFHGLGEGECLPLISEDGELLQPPVHPMLPKVERLSGNLVLHVILPHGPNPPQNVAFPETLENVPDGLVNIPK